MKLILIILMGVILVLLGIGWIAFVATRIERDFWDIFMWILYSTGVYFLLSGWVSLLVKWLEDE